MGRKCEKSEEKKFFFVLSFVVQRKSCFFLKFDQKTTFSHFHIEKKKLAPKKKHNANDNHH